MDQVETFDLPVIHGSAKASESSEGSPVVSFVDPGYTILDDGTDNDDHSQVRARYGHGGKLRSTAGVPY